MNVQLVSVGNEEEFLIPPPLPAELSLKVQLVIVGEEYKLEIPPPTFSAEFPKKVQLLMVR